VKNIFICIISFLFINGCDNISYKNSHTPRFEVLKTQNMFTTLLLDNRTGGVWQVQWSLDAKTFEGSKPITTGMVANENSYNGRFTLISTLNIWTYLLTDTKTGAMWHCQFSIEDKSDRGCITLVDAITDPNG
jgi:hypothetical protein